MKEKLKVLEQEMRGQSEVASTLDGWNDGWNSACKYFADKIVEILKEEKL